MGSNTCQAPNKWSFLPLGHTRALASPHAHKECFCIHFLLFLARLIFLSSLWYEFSVLIRYFHRSEPHEVGFRTLTTDCSFNIYSEHIAIGVFNIPW